MRQGQERIIIANLAETFYDFVNLDTNHFASALAIEQSIEEQGVFWAGNNSIVVTSKPLHPLHQQHLSRSLGYTNLVLHSPSSRSGRLSTDIVGDQDLLQRLIEPSAHNDLSMVVSPYCVTPEFVSLIENMIQGGAKITVPELPERENLWTVKNIDLKSGFRQVSRSLMSSSDIRIPEGFSCADLGQAMTVAHLFSKGGVECIIKPDNGEDGMGHVRIPAGSDINFIVRQIESNPFFRHGLVVVERYIKSDINIISPSIEYYVKDGKPLYLYSCAQTLSNTRTFLGVEVGSSVLPESIRVQMIRMGNAFGHVLGQLGYKGFFDIDFIVDEEQAVYAVEANLRRTGATHVHEIGKQIFGNNYEKKVHIRSSDVDACAPMSIESAFQRLDDLLYIGKGEREGVIVTVSDGIPEGRLGYVLFSEARENVSKLQEEIYLRLS